MKDRGQFERLSKLQESGDNEECWKEFKTKDIVRQSNKILEFRFSDKVHLIEGR